MNLAGNILGRVINGSLALAAALTGSELTAASDVKLPPNGPSTVVVHPSPPPVKLSAQGGWIYIKLPRFQYEPLTASPNGIVLLRDPASGKFARWKAGGILPLGPESIAARTAGISDIGANQGIHTFRNYAMSSTGSIALSYVYSSPPPDNNFWTTNSLGSVPTSGIWDEYIRVWSSGDDIAKIAQGYLYSGSIYVESDDMKIFSAKYARESKLVAINTDPSSGQDYISGLFSMTGYAFRTDYFYFKILAKTAPYSMVGISDSYGAYYFLTALNSRGQAIGGVWFDGEIIAGLVEGRSVPFAPCFISENGIILGRSGLNEIVENRFGAVTFPALRSNEAAQVMYSVASGYIPLPSDGRVTWVDELDRPNGFAPDGTPVVWTPKKNESGIPSPALGYDREAYVPLPPPEGWGSNPAHMIPPNTIKHQLGVLRKDTQTQPFLAIRGGLWVDGNRNGVIERDDSDLTTASSPFRFWINDDDDDGDEANQTMLGGNSDEPGKFAGLWDLDGRTPDHAHANVDGRCDLIDFFPVYLDIKQLLVIMPHTTAGLTYKLRQADSALRFVYTDLSRDRAFDYLTKEEQVYGTTLSKLPHNAETIAIPAAGVALGSAFLDKIVNGAEKGVILVEGTKASDKPLILEVSKDGQTIAQVQACIKISEVEKMYRWINLRSVAGQAETRPTDVDEPENYPDNRTNGKMFIWLHGYNVNEQQSRAWNSEAFKRLYQSGSRAMFSAVTWHGDHSQIKPIGASPDYWQNITYAFQTSAVLPAAVHLLPGSSKIIVGHSMGNVVVSSAIKDHGLNVTKYFMLNAAVALEAYDTTAMNVEAMLHPDWVGYDSHFWATEWHRLFPSDGRFGLTWRNRFGNIPNAINFYSSGEEVLNNNDTVSGGSPGKVPDNILGSERKWVLQEMVKGTQHIGAVLTFDSQGGWGFNGAWSIANTTTTGGPRGSTSTTYRRRTPAEAAELSDDQLRKEPFFRRFQDSRLMTSNGDVAASDYINRAQILGGAIPALSFPAGRNIVPLFGQTRNVDLMTKQDGWPKGRLDDNDKKNRWLHSDAKNIAYRYNYSLWDDWVILGDLK